MGFGHESTHDRGKQDCLLGAFGFRPFNGRGRFCRNCGDRYRLDRRWFGRCGRWDWGHRFDRRFSDYICDWTSNGLRIGSGGSYCNRLHNRRRRSRSRCRIDGISRRGDHRDHVAHVHGVALIGADLRQHARNRRWDFGVNLVRGDLEQQLVDCNRIADRLEPLCDGSLGN